MQTLESGLNLVVQSFSSWFVLYLLLKNELLGQKVPRALQGHSGGGGAALQFWFNINMKSVLNIDHLLNLIQEIKLLGTLLPFGCRISLLIPTTPFLLPHRHSQDGSFPPIPWTLRRNACKNGKNGSVRKMVEPKRPFAADRSHRELVEEEENWGRGDLGKCSRPKRPPRSAKVGGSCEGSLRGL